MYLELPPRYLSNFLFSEPLYLWKLNGKNQMLEDSETGSFVVPKESDLLCLPLREHADQKNNLKFPM